MNASTVRKGQKPLRAKNLDRKVHLDNAHTHSTHTALDQMENLIFFSAMCDWVLSVFSFFLSFPMLFRTKEDHFSVCHINKFKLISFSIRG